MEAVKLQNSVQAKGGSSLGTSTVQAASGNDFVKLLQEKKDLAEPVKNQTGKPDQTEDKGGRGQEVKDKVSEKTPGKPEKEENENISSEDTVGQDALLQAVLQQAAAQMTGILEVQEPVQQAAVQEGTVQEPEVDGIVSADGLPREGENPKAVQEPATQSVQKTEERPMEPVKNPEDHGREASLKEEDGRTGREQDPFGKAAGENRTESREAKEPVRNVQTSSAEAKAPSQREEGKEPVYSLHDGKGHMETVGTERKAEPIPMRTNEADLPQDLGKTLAARLPGRGQELTVELEPAALGKLTIRLVYEGDKAAVSIMASNPRTLELLSEKAAEIASILEEKTGQETVIYTHPSQQQNEEPDPNQEHGGGRENQEGQRQNHEDERHQTESFAQQLRLGLV